MTTETNTEVRTRQKREHFEKYEEFAQCLGVSELQALIPISQEKIDQALAEGDEHLNRWGNGPWDKQHGIVRREAKTCQCCKQSLPMESKDVLNFGVWGLVRAARLTSWSLCNSGCVLKHVAKHHPRGTK